MSLNVLYGNILNTAIAHVITVLDGFVSDPLFADKLALTFNTTVTPAQYLAALTTLPAFEVRSDQDLKGALGAFSAQTGKIYLTESLVTGDPVQLNAVLLEEIGHYLDFHFNGVIDSAGDEGDIFSRLVRGNSIDAVTLQALKAENDWATVTIDGQQVAIEQRRPRINITITWGDVHLQTFDQKDYDFQTVGEFILFKSLIDDFQVQTRQKAWNNSTTVSVNTAFATKIGGHNVVFDTELPVGQELKIDGRTYTLPSDKPIDIGNVQIQHLGNQYTFTNAGLDGDISTSDDNDILTIHDHDSYIDIGSDIADYRSGRIQGLLGNADRVSTNDFALRDGTDLGSNPSVQTIHTTFADSWRITQQESLFGTQTFADKSFPANYVSLETLAQTNPQGVANAFAKAREIGIPEGHFLNGGVLDFVVTGDVSFLQRAKQAANFVLQNGDIQILSPGTIAGSAWHDLNGDGFWDAGEPALGNWTIYSDLDNDGHLDTGEPSTVTSPTGQYSLNNLSTGLIHNIREKIPSTSWGWWTQTFPSNTLHIIYLSSGQTSAPNNFGNRYFDFLPDPIDLIINDVRVVEGDIAVVAVTLNQSATTAVTVNYAAVFGTGVGNATDADLVTATGAKGVLTFAPGETSKTITIATKNDTTAEVDEKFTINLTNPTGGVTISKATGTVTIADTVTSNVTTVLPTTKTNLILTGSGDINGTGNAVGNIITGNSGNNILNGGAGIDTLIGGNGKDIYVVDTITDTITENANEGTDTIQSSVTFTLATLPNIENLTLTGTAAINGTGNASNNTITGNAANNVLNGGAGNDILNGGAGNDTLNGGAGSDTLTGGAGNDVHVFQFGQSTATAPDRITDFAFGTDKIDLLTSSGLATPTPASFSRAANNTATTLTSVVTSVFADANGALAGLQALGVNSAALVVATNAAIAGTYLVINDGTANFQAANDLVVNLTGYTGTLPALGNITPVTNFFV